MLPSPLEANFVHHEDFELARSAKWELMQLRSRSTKPTADDVMLIARKAGLAEFLQHASRTTVDVVRADAWLAICTLADSIAKNARAIREDRHDKVVDSSLLWARAIDLCNAWMRAAEQPRRGLADLTTASHDIDAQAIQALALVPTRAPMFRTDDASAISNTCRDNGRTEIVKALEAAPIGSAITFATDNLGALCLAGAPVVRGTEAYRKVERLGQACNCSLSLHEEAGTITFYRR
jgi:hypothetical protein